MRTKTFKSEFSNPLNLDKEVVQERDRLFNKLRQLKSLRKNMSFKNSDLSYEDYSKQVLRLDSSIKQCLREIKYTVKELPRILNDKTGVDKLV